MAKDLDQSKTSQTMLFRVTTSTIPALAGSGTRNGVSGTIDEIMYVTVLGARECYGLRRELLRLETAK
jgi:hypothetical protein